MNKGKLGKINLEVSAVGLGAMRFSHGYGPGPSDGDAIGLMRKAFELGCTFYDTAEGYAAGENERLVGRAVAPIRNQGVIAIIAGPLVTCSARQPDPGAPGRIPGPARHRSRGAYYQRRVPDSIHVEDVAAVMGELIAEGKILGWGQSQPTKGAGPPRARRYAPDSDPERVLDDGAHVREGCDPDL